MCCKCYSVHVDSASKLKLKEHLLIISFRCKVTRSVTRIFTNQTTLVVRTSQGQGRHCFLSLSVTRCYIVLSAYVTLLANTRAYLYDRVESNRNNQSDPHSSHLPTYHQCIIHTLY